MSASVRTLTLAEAAFPRADFLRNLLLIVGASLATGVAAQVAVPLPWTPVPLTGQTFAVLLAGMVLGPWRGFLALALYLAEGAMGLPVFAGGASGVAKLLGPTAGYLFAFPLAAAVTGLLAERGWDRRVLTTMAAMLIGSGVIFIGGLAWLRTFAPPGQILAQGLYPFIPGDVVKAFLAALAFPLAWRRINGHRP